MPVDATLIDAACTALGVVSTASIGEGGQKSVRRVRIEQLPEPTDSDASVAEFMVVPRDPGDDAVLKVMQLGLTSPEALERAQREVLLLQSIDSPHVVRVRSDLVVIGDPPTGAAWLEELLPGCDLEQDVEGPWTPERAAALVGQVALGVAEMHDGKVVHRDLSPRNVRVVADDLFVVMDPGYARHELLPGITVASHPGTPGYMSPEHLQPPPNGPTPFSDVFCIGVLGYLALVGAPPIPYNGEREDYVNRLRTASHIPVTDLRDDVPVEFLRILSRCLHRQPARRFRHARELANAIQEIS